VLAISNATQVLLNKHLLSERGITSNHAFCPTCTINYIESALRDNFDRYAAAGFGKISFGAEINDPESLFDSGYDAVILAGGRQSLTDAWRRARGLDVSTNGSEEVLVIKYNSAQGSHRNRSLEDSYQQSLAKTGKVFIRPGISEDQGYVWIIGIPSDFASRARVKLAKKAPFVRFSEIHDTLGGISEPNSTSGSASAHISEALVAKELDDASSEVASPLVDSKLATSSKDPLVLDSPKTAPAASGDWLSHVFRLLDERLQPVSVAPRVTTAEYWRSTEVVHQSKDRNGNHRGWLVLAGDAACGRPFHLGTNLNGHFADTVTLVRDSPWSRWNPDDQPFRKYVDRYRMRTASAGFRRCGNV